MQEIKARAIVAALFGLLELHERLAGKGEAEQDQRAVPENARGGKRRISAPRRGASSEDRGS